jgi:hypothetical protein
MGYSYAYRIVMARSGLVAVERVKRRRDTDLFVVEYRLRAHRPYALFLQKPA